MGSKSLWLRSWVRRPSGFIVTRPQGWSKDERDVTTAFLTAKILSEFSEIPAERVRACFCNHNSEKEPPLASTMPGSLQQPWCLLWMGKDTEKVWELCTNIWRSQFRLVPRPCEWQNKKGPVSSGSRQRWQGLTWERLGSGRHGRVHYTHLCKLRVELWESSRSLTASASRTVFTPGQSTMFINLRRVLEHKHPWYILFKGPLC